MILSSTVTTIKTVFEPAQLAKVEITSNGFNLAINQVNHDDYSLMNSLIKYYSSLLLQRKINLFGLIVLNVLCNIDKVIIIIFLIFYYLIFSYS